MASNFSNWGRQSLVTPIDWKLHHCRDPGEVLHRRQSLVTPIDWKLAEKSPATGKAGLQGRQSLVTPIDWKRGCNSLALPMWNPSPILGDAY